MAVAERPPRRPPGPGAGRPRTSRCCLAALDARSLPAAVDRAGDGRRAGARLAGAAPERLARQAAGRHGQPADRRRPAADDVPGAGEGPLRGPRPRPSRWRQRPPLLRRLAVPLLGRRAAADVRAGLDLPLRPARVPHRRDHRRAGALHRDGAGLERDRPRRPRARRRAGRLQRDLPARRLLAARLLLPDRAPGLARPCTPRASSPGSGRSPAPS